MLLWLYWLKEGLLFKMGNLQENINFFNKIARYYDKGIFGIWLNRILIKLLKEIEIKENSIILDVGCGTGNFLKILSKNKTLILCGLDISPKMIKIAKKKLGKKANLKLMPIENLRDKNKFNYIFSTEAFHHYSNQKKAMRNFYYALKKNGRLIIVDLSFGRILNWIFHKIEPGNSGMNSRRDFYRLLKKYGFRNIQQKRLSLVTIMTLGEKTETKTFKYLNK